MAENRSNTRIRADEQLVFINTGKIIGLQDISIANNIGAAPLLYLGIRNRPVNHIPISEQSASVSANGFLINSDYFINLTGAIPVNLFVLKDKTNLHDNYCLVSGYLNSYSSRYSVGSPIQIAAEMTFYGNCGTIPTGQLATGAAQQLQQIYNNDYSNLDSTYLIADDKSIDLTLDEYATNLVTDFSIAINTNRLPINNMGRRTHVRNELVYPLDVRCSFTFNIAKNYSGNRLFDFPQIKRIQNISLQANDYSTNAAIATYSFNNMSLINESRSINTDGNTVVSVSYNGFIHSGNN